MHVICSVLNELSIIKYLVCFFHTLLNYLDGNYCNLKKIKFENNTRLQHLVFGYKMFDNEYVHQNYFLNYIGIYNLQILLCIRTKDKEN